MAFTKIYTLFAGVNGAGKSTLYLSNKDMIEGVRLNVDEIVRELGGDWQNIKIKIDPIK